MRFHIISLGCPKNDVDSEAMRLLLLGAGYEETEEPALADFLIVNTCGFIQAAIQESLEVLGRLAVAKREGQYLVAAGCLAQRMGKELHRAVVGVDGILGTLRWGKIVTLVEGLRSGQPLGSFLGFPPTGESFWVERRLGPNRSAYIKISEGCDGPCLFCTLPGIKGPYRSRPKQDILREAKMLAQQGAQELILIGQNITAYGQDRGEDGLPSLVEELAREVPEVPWVRLMYAYPYQVGQRLIEVMASLPQVCHYLDMPLQHANPTVLRRMGRPGDLYKVLETINRLRSAMPDIALRTSFIVGYPGETEEQFTELLRFMELVKFDKVGLFRFSPEEGTPAAELPDQVPEPVKAERYERCMELQGRISLERNREIVGRNLEVLVEGAGDGISVGRCYRDAPEVDGLVLVKGEYRPGEMVSVRIAAASEYDLWGEPSQKG